MERTCWRPLFVGHGSDVISFLQYLYCTEYSKTSSEQVQCNSNAPMVAAPPWFETRNGHKPLFTVILAEPLQTKSTLLLTQRLSLGRVEQLHLILCLYCQGCCLLINDYMIDQIFFSHKGLKKREHVTS